jgi:hypothetical protein
MLKVIDTALEGTMKPLGVLLIVISVIVAAALMPNLFIPNYPTAGLVDSVFCGQDELITSVTQVTATYRTRYSSGMACGNPETGEVRSITTMFTIISAVVSALPLIIGVAMLGIGRAMGASSQLTDGMNEAEKDQFKQAMDQLNKDARAGRISGPEYMRRMSELTAQIKASPREGV